MMTTRIEHGRFATACFAFFLTVLLLSGCSKSGTNDNEAEFTEEDAAAIRDEVLDSLSTSAINKQLRAAGEPFHTEMVNDINSVKRYIITDNTGPAAANLGVYMSDLGYLVEYGKKDMTRTYFFACLQLSSHAGVNKQFGEAVGLRFNEIISGNESLEESLNYLFRNVDNEIEGENLKKTHAIALAGYYFEELYHVVTLVKLYESKSLTDSSRVVVKSALNSLLNQKQGIDNLVRYFDHIKIQPQGVALYQDLLRLQARYQTLETGRLLAEPDIAVTLADKDVIDIQGYIISIRNGITNY